MAQWPLMEVPPLASPLNNSARGKMANIQHCRVGEQEAVERVERGVEAEGDEYNKGKMETS